MKVSAQLRDGTIIRTTVVGADFFPPDMSAEVPFVEIAPNHWVARYELVELVYGD